MAAHSDRGAGSGTAKAVHDPFDVDAVEAGDANAR